MRQSIKLSVSDKIRGDVSLPWTPDHVHCINPNNANLYLRVGANDIPIASTADMRFPRQMFTAYPLAGAIYFGYQLGDPGDTINDITYLVFTKDEDVPTFGSVPITSVNATIAGTVTVNGNVAIPSGVITNAGSVTQTGSGSITTTQSGSQTAVPGGVVTNTGSVTQTGSGSITTTQSGSQTAVPGGVITNSGSQTAVPGGVVTNSGSVTQTGAGSQTAVPGGVVTNSGSQTTVPGGVVTNSGSQTTVPGGVITNSGSQTYPGVNNSSWHVTQGFANLTPGNLLNLGAYVNTDNGGWLLILSSISGPDVRFQWFTYTGVGNQPQRAFRLPSGPGFLMLTLPAFDQGIVIQLYNDLGPGTYSAIYYIRRLWQNVNEIGITTLQDLPLTTYDINLTTVVGNVRGPQLVSGGAYDERWLVGYQLTAVNNGVLAGGNYIELWTGTNVALNTFIGRFNFDAPQTAAPTYQFVNTPYMQPNAGQPGGLLMTTGNDYLWIGSNTPAVPVRGAAFARRKL